MSLARSLIGSLNNAAAKSVVPSEGGGLPTLQLPSTVIGKWDATALGSVPTSLENTAANAVLGAMDLSGLSLTRSTDAYSGNTYLRSVGESWSITDFGSDISSTADYCMIYAGAFETIGAVAGGCIMGSDVARRVQFGNGSTVFVTTPAANQNIENDGAEPRSSRNPISPVLIVAEQIGGQKRVSVFTSSPNYSGNTAGAGYLKIPRKAYAAATLTSYSSGMTINFGQATIRFYGMLYLEDCSLQDARDAEAWAAKHWLLGNRTAYCAVEGDSLTHVVISQTDRHPGWHEVIGEDASIKTKMLMQNWANGGERIIDDGSSLWEYYNDRNNYYLDLFSRAAPNKAYVHLLAGVNDYATDAATPAAIISASEDFAAQVTTDGGLPCYGGIAFNFAGDDALTGRGLVAATIWDDIAGGTSNFTYANDALRNDSIMGIGVNGYSVEPTYYETDQIHPLTVGNAYIGAAQLSFFTGLI